jgi:hypothetical protein
LLLVSKDVRHNLLRWSNQLYTCII